MTYAAALRRFDADVEQGAAPSQAIRRRPTLYLASLRRDDGSVLTLDANGKVKKTHRDVRNLITSVAEFNQGSTLWTSYAYDPLKQIVQVIDDKNNTTTVTYDHLGRRTSIDNPDTGKTETVYDLASNVTAKITANLRSTGQQVVYDYDFNRLKSVTYPQFAGNNIAYTYGAPGAAHNT